MFEVLSDSTEKYDRDFKAANYRRIDSLRTYVLLSQKTHHVEVFERQADGSWTPHEERGEDAVIELPAIGVELPLKSLYYKVEFQGPPTR